MATPEGTPTPPAPGRSRPSWFAEALAALSAVIAGAALAGSLFHAPGLGSLGRGFVPLSPLAGALFILLDAAILLRRRGRTRLLRSLGTLCGALVIALTLGMVAGFALEGPLWAALELRVVSKVTAVTLLLGGLAFAMSGGSPLAPRWKRQVAALPALAAAAICAVVLLSYAAGAPLLYQSGNTPMALPSALAGLMTALALAALPGRDTWPRALFPTPGAPGRGPMAAYVLTALAILVGGSFYLRGQLAKARAATQDGLASIADLKAGQIAEWHRERLADARQIAGSALLQGHLARFLAGTGPEGEMREWLDGLRRGGVYRDVALFDAQGRRRLPGHGPDPGDRVRPALAARKVVLDDLVRDAAGIHMDLWVPAGPGILLLRVDPAPFLFPLLQSWPGSSASAETLLVRREGGDAVFLNDLRHRAGTALALRMSIAGNPSLPASHAALGAEGLMRGRDYRGVPVLAAIRNIPGTPWSMVAKVDEEEIFGPLRAQGWVSGATLLGLVTLLALGVSLSLRQMETARVAGQLARERRARILEGRYQSLLRLANDAILTFDAQGRILDANDRALEYYGYTLAEFRGLSVPDLRTPGDGPLARRQFAELSLTGRVRFEATHMRKDGTTFPVEVSSRLLEIEGEPVAFSIIHDITDRRARERQAQESGEQYRRLFEQSPVGYLTLDEAGRIRDVNGTLLAMLGCGREDLAGRPFWDLMTPESAEAARRLHGAGAGRIPPTDFTLVRGDGATLVVNLEGAAAFDASGRFMHTQCALSDLTDRLAAEAAHRELQAQLHQSQKMESLGSLAGGVAHDINNVLAAILSLASAHREALDAADPLAQSMDTITRACLRGRDVVKSLLFFARKGPATLGPVDLNGVVRDLVQLLARTTLKRVRLETDLQEPLPFVHADTGTLSHALMNVCVNAKDAMPQGGTLRIRTRILDDGAIQVSVKDTGEGMSEDVRRRAMEPFFTTKPQGQGTGLGLAMVFGTLKALGGSTEIRSEPGQGTEVLLTFPAPAAGTDPGAPQAGSSGPAHSVRPLDILLVDDDELIRGSVVPMLQLLGHRAKSVDSGLKALNLFQGGLEVDLVILDMNMPGINGAETLHGILLLRPGQPVIMASGYNDHDLAQLLEGRPTVVSVQKPFHIQEIQRCIAALGL